MDDPILITLISALGIKEVWNKNKHPNRRKYTAKSKDSKDGRTYYLYS